MARPPLQRLQMERVQGVELSFEESIEQRVYLGLYVNEMRVKYDVISFYLYVDQSFKNV